MKPTHLLSSRAWMKCFAAFAAFAGTMVFAAPIPIANFSFETAGTAPNGPGDAPDATLASWDYDRDGLASLSDVTFLTSPLATNGTNLAVMNFLIADVAGGISISQDLGLGLLANSIYTLSFSADQFSSVNLLTAASAQITAGGVTVASLTNASFLSLLNDAGPLDPVSFQFITGGVAPAGNLGVKFEIDNVLGVAGTGLVLDNVRMDVTPVPEPSGALLLSLAGLHFILRRRRRR